MEEVVVTGTLVKPSFERFAMWSKVLFLLQLILFVYRMLTEYDSNKLFVFICTFSLFGIWLPLCGYSSASALDRTCLALFSCVQSGLSLIMLLVLLMLVLCRCGCFVLCALLFVRCLLPPFFCSVCVACQ